jgi:chromosome partitioning protein
MTYVTTYASSKGGVGKTTLLEATTTELRLRGQTCLLLDADPNRHLSEWSKLRGDDGVKVIDGLDESNIRQSVKENAADYDHVLIDLAGFGTMTMVYAFAVSDLVVIPSLRSRMDVKETIRTYRNVIDSMAEMRHQPATRVVLTRGKQAIRSRVSKHAETQLLDRELPMLRCELMDWALLEEMTYSGKGPCETQPDSNAACNVRAVTDAIIEVLENVVPNPAVPRKSGDEAKGAKVRSIRRASA